MTKEKLKKLLEQTTITDEQKQDAYELFYKDATSECALLVEFTKFWQVLLSTDGQLGDYEIHKCSYAYIVNIENNHPNLEAYLVALYNREAEYFTFFNCPKESLYYSQKILEMENVDRVYHAASIVYILNILATSKLYSKMLDYVPRIKALIDDELLQPIYRKVLKLSLVDIYTFNNKYREYLDILNDILVNENKYGPNDPTKESAAIHFATSKFAFNEILKFKKKDELLLEFDQIIKSLKGVHGVVDSIESNLIPVFNVIREIMPREELIAKVFEILNSRICTTDKLVIYEYLIRNLGVTYEEYPDAFKKYFILLEKYTKIRSKVERQTIEIDLIEYDLQQRYKEAALTDKLTGLGSRNAYMDDLEKVATCNDLAIIVADINRLKYINDNYGHDVGDQALIVGAKKLIKVFGKMGKIYRFGGDEFYIIAHANKEDIVKAIEKLNKLNEEPFLEGFKFEISVGYALACEYPGENLDYIIRMADKYMYQSKMKFYNDPEMQRRVE